MREIWKDVKGKKFYQVSNLGRVRSLDRTITTGDGVKKEMKGKVLKPFRGVRGLMTVHLGTKYPNQHVHRLVADAFIPNPKDHRDVAFKDEDRTNCRVSNLKRVSHSKSFALAKDMGAIFGRTPKGEA